MVRIQEVRSVLLEATIRGDVELLRSELSKPGVDLEACDPFENTPLMEAAENGFTECVRELLLAGANPDQAADFTCDEVIRGMIKQASVAKARGVRWLPTQDVANAVAGESSKKKKVKGKKGGKNKSSKNRGYKESGQAGSVSLKVPARGVARPHTENKSSTSPESGQADPAVKSKNNDGQNNNAGKTIPCRYFKRGRCCFGDVCWYRHDEVVRPTQPSVDKVTKRAAAMSDSSESGSDSDVLWGGFMGGYMGFSESDVEELICQGVKPWDDDAAAVLGVLYGLGDSDYDDYL